MKKFRLKSIKCNKIRNWNENLWLKTKKSKPTCNNLFEVSYQISKNADKMTINSTQDWKIFVALFYFARLWSVSIPAPDVEGEGRSQADPGQIGDEEKPCHFVNGIELQPTCCNSSP